MSSDRETPTTVSRLKRETKRAVRLCFVPLVWIWRLVSNGPPDRCDIREAKDQGWLGHQTKAVCPYPHGPLGDAWRKGWDEAEEFERQAW